MPCRRHNSPGSAPASDSLRMAMICSSLKRLLRTTPPRPSQADQSGKKDAPEDLDFGRVQAYVAAGIIVANNNSANGSSGSNSAAQFLSFDIDKTWALPGCYRLVPGQNSTRCKPIPA